MTVPGLLASALMLSVPGGDDSNELLPARPGHRG